MIQKIVTLPAPILTLRSHKVRNQSKDYINKVKQDLLDTVKARGGLGLAAPQIGVGLRIVAYLTSPPDNYKVIVNPEITHQSTDDQEEGIEGCFSIPGFLAYVSRPRVVRVRWEGNKGIIFSGMSSRVLQHEIDHLEGHLIIDKAVKKEVDPQFVSQML